MTDDEHDCATCADCIHDGRKCCGCYDGVCCWEPCMCGTDFTCMARHFPTEPPDEW